MLGGLILTIYQEIKVSQISLAIKFLEKSIKAAVFASVCEKYKNTSERTVSHKNY